MSVEVLEYTGPHDTPEFQMKVASDVIQYANNWYTANGFPPSIVARVVARAAAFVAGWSLTYNNDAVLTSAELDAACAEFRKNIIKYVAENAPVSLGREFQQ